MICISYVDGACVLVGYWSRLGDCILNMALFGGR